MNALLPFWNQLIVHPLMHALELVATPFLGVVPAGVAGGLAIILFTILLRLLLVPLSLVQIRSQRHQMAIQPELKALQKKFKGDREGMARAQMQHLSVKRSCRQQCERKSRCAVQHGDER